MVCLIFMENTFRVGYSRRTVTPTEPIPLAGFSNELKRFHTRVTEPICVTCVALSDAEDNSVLMIGIDACTAGKVAIRARQVTVFGKIDHSNDHLIEQAKEILALWKETYDKPLCVEKAAPYGLHGPYHASATVANYSRTDEEDGKLILNAVAIGDHFAFVTYPGEMFDSISVRIEENSPFAHTLLLGYCYHHAGYLPSSVAYKYGSYEVDVTRFQCGMGETIADTYNQMLKELK